MARFTTSALVPVVAPKIQDALGAGAMDAA
jgi:hypothetical protein